MNPLRKLTMKFNPVQLMVLGYLMVIVAGTALLALPVSTRGAGSAGFLTALFTATSATCVTGLVVADTYTHWTLFGQNVILLLIQVGGLGYMTMAAMMSFFIKRHITLKERLVMMNCFNLSGVSGVVRLTRNVIVITLIAELAGTVLLSFRFIPMFGFAEGLYTALFTSVSAFCNAGFDIMGKIEPFTSLTTFQGDILVNITVMLLIIIGGIGFSVWDDMMHRNGIRRLTPYSQAVLSISGILIAAGTAGFLLFEHSNPGTIGAMTPGEGLLASLFQSVTCRTAGFNTIDTAALTGPSKLLSSMLMFVGGSSGSTAGGIKTMTLGILVFLVISSLRGRKEVVIRGRRVNQHTVIKAIAVTGAALMALAAGILLMQIVDPHLGFQNIVFEAVSAMGTVGLTTGVTTLTGTLSRIVLILLMFFGRVGILSISVSLLMKADREKTAVYHPEGDFITG